MYARFFYSFRRFSQKILDMFFPVFCVICQKNTGTDICDTCLKAQKISPQRKCLTADKNFWVSSFFSYGEVWIQQLIKRGKFQFAYQNFFRLSVFVGYEISNNEKFLGVSSEIFPENSVLLPVPLHYFRFQKRGFNQSQIIAEGFQKIFSYCKIIPLVKRIRHTPHQSRLSREEREKNLSGAFAFDTNFLKKVSKNTPIIVIDDVVSSGSTLLEIQKILFQEGFTNISAVTLAQGGGAL